MARSPRCLRATHVRVALVSLLVGFAAGLVAWPAGAEDEPPRDPPGVSAPLLRAPEAGFVGTDRCATCHADEVATWRRSSHAHTFLPVGPDNLPQDVLDGATVAHPPGETSWRRDGERFLARTTGPDGTPTDYHLTHAIGRMRVQMFVATLPDGRQQVLPAMFEVPTGNWFDYTRLLFGAPGLSWDEAPIVHPGDASFWTGPTRSWDSSCARCHTSGSRPLAGAPVAAGPRLEARALGVDCEMCHGPGEAHVAWHEERNAGREPATSADPIVRLLDLARDDAVAVCLQCHMEADLVRRDFRPGDDLFEHVDPTLLVDPERIDPTGRVTELVYDGLPFSVSRCATEGALTCATCHDPHGGSQPSQLRYAPDDPRLCIGCHDDIGRDIAAHTHHALDGSGSSCVACHMPFLEIERGHGYVADHSISIPRPGLALEADRLARDACSTCHTPGPLAASDAKPKSIGELATAAASWWPNPRPLPDWVPAIAAARRKEPGAHTALIAVLDDPEAPRMVRASAMQLLTPYARAVPVAVLRRLADPDSLVRRRAVGALAALEGPAAAVALRRALDDPSLAVRTAAARAALDGFDRVRREPDLLAAIRPHLAADAAEVPEDPVRWYAVGAAADLAGDVDEAIRGYENMLRLDPFSPRIAERVRELKTAER